MSRHVTLLLVYLACCVLLSQAGPLTELYNSRVVKAQRYTRPLALGDYTWIARQLGLKHSGVVVTLQNGERWLVHKGNEYGQESETVVTPASNMVSVWTLTDTKTIRYSTVGDYVRAGGSNYNVAFDNCHHASARMMQLN